MGRYRNARESCPCIRRVGYALTVGGPVQGVNALVEDDRSSATKVMAGATRVVLSWRHAAHGGRHGDNQTPQTIRPGAGGDLSAELAVAKFWRRDQRRRSGAHLVIDTDGSVGCLADLAAEEMFHAGSRGVSRAWAGTAPTAWVFSDTEACRSAGARATRAITCSRGYARPASRPSTSRRARICGCGSSASARSACRPTGFPGSRRARP